MYGSAILWLSMTRKLEPHTSRGVYGFFGDWAWAGTAASRPAAMSPGRMRFMGPGHAPGAGGSGGRGFADGPGHVVEVGDRAQPREDRAGLILQGRVAV